MFGLEIPAWTIIARTVVIYLVLLVGLRLVGKREIGQMTIFDLVVLLLLANAVQNAMVGPDTSVLGGLIAALTLLGVDVVVARTSLRWPRLRRIIVGSPTVLVLNGEVIEDHLHHEGLDRVTLEAALREHGVASLGDVQMAVLEVDGTISVVPGGTPTKRIKHPHKFLQHH